MHTEKLTEAEESIFRTGICPDCGGGLLTGPSGGIATNYLCGGLGESKYNDMQMFGVDRLGVARCPKVRPIPVRERFSITFKLSPQTKEVEPKPSFWKRTKTIGDPLFYQMMLLLLIICLLVGFVRWK